MAKLASHHLPCPVVFICTAHGDQRDIMTATGMFVTENGNTLCVSVAKGHLTTELIQASGQFTVALAGPELADVVWQAGSVRGQDKDKFEALNIQASTPDGALAPVPAQAVAWMQCQVSGQKEVGDYLVVFGEVTGFEQLSPEPLIWYRDKLFGLKSLK